MEKTLRITLRKVVGLSKCEGANSLPGESCSEYEVVDKTGRKHTMSMPGMLCIRSGFLDWDDSGLLYSILF